MWTISCGDLTRTRTQPFWHLLTPNSAPPPPQKNNFSRTSGATFGSDHSNIFILSSLMVIHFTRAYVSAQVHFTKGLWNWCSGDTFCTPKQSGC